MSSIVRNDEGYGHAAHCRRVAAYCDEMAANLNLSARDRGLLRQLALQHHRATKGFGSEAVGRLAADLGIELSGGCGSSDQPDQERMALLMQIVDVADDLDHEIEFNAYGDKTLSESLRSALDDIFEHPAIGMFLPNLRRSNGTELRNQLGRLPVFPSVALQVIRAASGRRLTPENVVRLASSDQVLAGSLLAAANAAAYTWSGTVRSVQAAVMYLGEGQSAQVLLAAAMKPVLARGRTFGSLWEHSVEAARLAEQIARRCGVCDPGEAYVIGLLHDAGKLLLQLAPPAAVISLDRLIRNGCAPAVAEVLTCGVTHAEAGGDVLRHWSLPEDYITAVQFHHEPEHSASSLPSLLYVVEHCLDAEEDLPSSARLRHALEATRLKPEDLEACKASIRAA